MRTHSVGVWPTPPPSSRRGGGRAGTRPARFALVAIAGFAWAASAGASTNLLVNGGFEAPSGGYIPSNQRDRRFNDGSLVVPGWNFAIGSSSDVYRDKDAAGVQSPYYEAAAGDWFAGSGSFFTTNEGVSQTFDVVPNTWHRVAFEMAPGGINYGGNWIENATIGSSRLVDVTGAVAATVSRSFHSNLAGFDDSATTNPLVWMPRALYFLSDAVGGPVTLRFTAYGDMTHVFLDYVVVTEWPAPVGDDCAAATVISGPGPHAFDDTVCSRGTQGQAEAPCRFDGQTAIEHDQWYVWTAGANGLATLMTCGGIAAGSGQDTKVAVYLGSACTTAPAIACNDDATCGSSSLTSVVTWKVACGQQYLIRLGPRAGCDRELGHVHDHRVRHRLHRDGLLLGRRHGDGVPVRQQRRARARLRELDRPERRPVDGVGSGARGRRLARARRKRDARLLGPLLPGHGGGGRRFRHPVRRRPALRRRHADPPPDEDQRRRSFAVPRPGRSADLRARWDPARRRCAPVPGLVPQRGRVLHGEHVQPDERAPGRLAALVS